MIRKSFPSVALLLFVFLPTFCNADTSLTLVVMDPLSKPLSCDCVQGYAQRKYQRLGDYLAEQLGRSVKLVWNESLVEAVKETGGSADLVIGKHSVVLHDARELERTLEPIAQLTGSDGETTQQGLIVVRSGDTAQRVADLKGYRVFLGPIEAEEKSAAPISLLEQNGVSIPQEPERFGACSEAAVALLKLPKDTPAAAVISSYAEPLLKGCGSVREGELSVIGKTKDVPFVTAFVSDEMDEGLREELQSALLMMITDMELCTDLETLLGFVPWEESDSKPDVSVKVKN